MLTFDCYILDENNIPKYVCELRDALSNPIIRMQPTWPTKLLWLDKIEGVEISTVFYGIDDSGWGKQPRLFQTLISCRNPNHPFHNYDKKYSTFAEAHLKHHYALESITTYFVISLLDEISPKD
ncbi:hypothetical protein J2T02_002634 [Chitinophaga terrae (ex Kim and Jung 2007)]|nr:hypothetical protein [Chitinophaga terrae (ex Kim and Jung 2007)]